MSPHPSIIALALAGSVGAAALAAGQQTTIFRTGTDPVNLGVTVTDRKGNLVTGLTVDDFAVFEDGKRQTVTYFASGGRVDQPGQEMHLGLLIDVSASMGANIDFTKTAAIRFLNKLTDAVDITVVDFDTQVRVARYEQSGFVRLIERLRLQTASGNTALYDAIGMYLDSAGEQGGRKIMLLYTDGGDTTSALGFDELLDLLKASDVTVYVIGQLEQETQLRKSAQRLVLEQIADATGGQAFFPLRIEDLNAFYGKVLAQIRAQYTLGYQSTNDNTDGAWRKVEIRVAREDARDDRIRSRSGYYALYKKP